eukprot:1140179-Pelagomonas_calceolata.AAC.2
MLLQEESMQCTCCKGRHTAQAHRHTDTQTHNTKEKTHCACCIKGPRAHNANAPEENTQCACCKRKTRVHTLHTQYSQSARNLSNGGLQRLMAAGIEDLTLSYSSSLEAAGHSISGPFNSTAQGTEAASWACPGYTPARGFMHSSNLKQAALPQRPLRMLATEAHCMAAVPIRKFVFLLDLNFHNMHFSLCINALIQRGALTPFCGMHQHDATMRSTTCIQRDAAIITLLSSHYTFTMFPDPNIRERSQKLAGIQKQQASGLRPQRNSTLFTLLCAPWRSNVLWAVVQRSKSLGGAESNSCRIEACMQIELMCTCRLWACVHTLSRQLLLVLFKGSHTCMHSSRRPLGRCDKHWQLML